MVGVSVKTHGGGGKRQTVAGCGSGELKRSKGRAGNQYYGAQLRSRVVLQMLLRGRRIPPLP